MKSFLAIVLLELRRLWRSRSILVLLAACVGWMLAMPHLVKSDGTVEGARQIYVHFSLGGAFALTCIALASSGASVLSREREMRTLSLALTRPVKRFTLVFARIAALVASGAAVLAVCALVLFFNERDAGPCAHVLHPEMESLAEEAKRMYDYYMADPETPPEIKKAKKSVVMRILRQGALDHYQSIGTNDTAAWRFDSSALAPGAPLAVRLRFTNDFDMREDVRGDFSFGPWRGAISNITQAIVRVPLHHEEGGNPAAGAKPKDELVFTNNGATSLMLRPRKDIVLLAGADSFGANLFRAWLELVSMLASLVAFAVFLGSGLGRSVAVFTCVAFMFVVVVSGDVIEQYPDQFENDRVDRIGLAITRAVEFASRPVNSLRPLSALSSGECVEKEEAAMVVAMDAVLIPVVFAFLAAFILSRKED